MKKLFKRMFNPDGKNMIPKEQSTIDYLILNNALEVVGLDSNSGEFLYAFTPKIKEVMPDLYHEHLNHVNKEIMAMWEIGFVNVDFFKDEPLITLTDKAFNEAETKNLSEELQWALKEVKRLINQKEL